MAIRRMNIFLNVKSEQFQSAMRSARGSILAFQATVQTARRATLGLFTGLTGLGAGGILATFGLMVRRSSAFADSLLETAQAIGISTRALAGLQLRAEQTGISVGELHRAITIMQRTAASDVGKDFFKDRFTRLPGLSAADIVGDKPDVALSKIADALQKIGNASERTRAAMDVFGRGGANMLRLLQDGSKGLSDAIKRSGELGIGIDEREALRLGMISDLLVELKSAFLGLSNVLTMELAPAVIAGLEGITRWLEGGGKAFEGFASRVGGSLALIAEKSQSVGDTLSGWFDGAFFAGMYALNRLKLGAASALSVFEPENKAMAKGFGSRTFAEQKIDFKSYADSYYNAMKRAFSGGSANKRDAASVVTDWFGSVFGGMESRTNELRKKFMRNQEAAAEADPWRKMIEDGMKRAEKYRKERKKIFDSLQSDVGEFGLSKADVAIKRMRDNFASTFELKQARGLTRIVTGLEDFTSIASEGRNAINELRSDFVGLQGLFQSGAISAEVYSSAISKLMDEAKRLRVESVSSPFSIGFREINDPLEQRNAGGILYGQQSGQRQLIELEQQQNKTLTSILDEMRNVNLAVSGRN